MEKYNKYLEVAKKIWAIKSLRAIIIIFVYMIFFGFVIAGIRTGYSESINKPSLQIENQDSYETKQNYGASIKINDQTYNFINKNNKNYLIINDIYYDANTNNLKPVSYITGEEIEAEIPNLPIKFWLFTPSVISKLVKNATLEYKTEFTNKDIKKGYIVNMQDVFDNIDAGISILENKTIDNNNIKIEILERDNNIVSLILDLTNYNQLFIETDQEYKVEIEYKEV
jgi:hypothetical protein